MNPSNWRKSHQKSSHRRVLYNMWWCRRGTKKKLIFLGHFLKENRLNIDTYHWINGGAGCLCTYFRYRINLRFLLQIGLKIKPNRLDSGRRDLLNLPGVDSIFFFSHAAISLIGGEGERKCWVGGWGVHAAVIPRWRCGSLSLFRVYPQRIIYDRPRLHLVFHPSPGKARVAVRIGSLLRPRPPSSTSRRTPPRRRGVASGAATRWSPWGARRSPCASAAVSARLCPRSAWFPSPHRKPWPEG